MQRILSFSLVALIVFCLLVGTEQRAWGYVDPGSGLLTLQALSSAIAASAYFLRRRLRSLFSRTDAEQSLSSEKISLSDVQRAPEVTGPTAGPGNL
jgi:hypothetical protein